MKVILLLAMIALPQITFSAEKDLEKNLPKVEDKKNTSISFNYGQFLAFAATGKAIDDGTGDGNFFPFHLTWQRKTEDGKIHELDFVYRYDAHSTFESYNEFIVMYGRRWHMESDDEWTWGVKGGLGYVTGTLNNGAEDDEFFSFEPFYEDPNYRCLQGTLQIDAYKEKKISKNFHTRYGGGVLGILPLSCENEPTWSGLGLVVHRFVPIVNAGITYWF